MSLDCCFIKGKCCLQGNIVNYGIFLEFRRRQNKYQIFLYYSLKGEKGAEGNCRCELNELTSLTQRMAKLEEYLKS